MNTILLFVIPPIAGAIIGFVTNVIAIRMLFRPLKEVRIFGMQLPFTPGILPRQRKTLAVSIGSMVERELLTAEILRERLSRDDVKEKIKQTISRITKDLLEKTPSELSLQTGFGSGKENFLTKRIPSAIENVYPVFTNAVMQFLQRNDIRRELEARGRIILRNVLFKLNSFQRFFVSAGQYDQTLEEKMPEIIDELINGISNLINENNVKQSLITAAGNSINNLISEQNKTIAELLNVREEDKEKLDDYLLEKLTEAVNNQIEKVLSSIDIKTLVSDRIDSLEMIRVERIILDVLSNQLKYVELFGGVLGFLMGLFQATFSFFVR
ncbi:MAG: DUF445 family protein [Treponema sp.]|nr:DUF445 family protein [Treponema sp.]MCL2250298.1 DUF445 family protein [Treponema sp.]